jgi:cytochrome c-type biogenesis protein
MDFLGLFTLGLTYGLTVCSLTCLPYLVPYFMGAGKGFGDGVKNTGIFISGKLFTYTIMGLLQVLLVEILI